MNIKEIIKDIIAESKKGINIPISVGDTILGGKFKNKKVIVKKIGKNEKGDITINGKPLLRFRIPKNLLEDKGIDANYYKIKGKHINNP